MCLIVSVVYLEILYSDRYNDRVLLPCVQHVYGINICIKRILDNYYRQICLYYELNCLPVRYEIVRGFRLSRLSLEVRIIHHILLTYIQVNPSHACLHTHKSVLQTSLQISKQLITNTLDEMFN